jgi:hypothetical protein
MSGWYAAALAACVAAPALAEDMVSGVYLESAELCEQARKESLQAVLEAGHTMLTARGIEAIEYNCEFVQATSASRSPAWLVHAICQEPGFIHPDVLSLTQLSPTQIELVSVRPEDPDGVGGNGGSYVLCDGVSAP